MHFLSVNVTVVMLGGTSYKIKCKQTRTYELDALTAIF